MNADSAEFDPARRQLDRLAEASAFRGANRSLQLLRYLVEETQSGRGAYIKEYTVGSEVLGRGASFDPREDSIVRVEASRLRQRLEHYYATEGSTDEILIQLPRGSYVPQITRRPAPQTVTPPAPSPGRLRWIAVALVSLPGGLLAGWWWRDSAPATATTQPIHLEVDLGPDVAMNSEPGNGFALSPDGRVMVYASLRPDGSSRLLARAFDGSTARELPGTHGARAPFFSPDGAWVGFWAQGKIKKTLVSGAGSPVVLAPATDLLGASWSAANEIVAQIGQQPVLWKLSAAGGEPVVLVDLSTEQLHPRWPQWLPGGKAVLYTAMFGAANRSVEVVDLTTGKRKTLIASGTYGRFLPNGNLAYVDRGTLFEVPFNLKRLEASGPPATVVRAVAESFFGNAQFDVASNGMLVYRAAPDQLTKVVWLTREGNAVSALEAPGRHRFPRLSPDASRLALAVLEESDYDIWIMDLEKKSRSRLTNGTGDEGSPVWTPAGDALVYNSNGGPMTWIRADGASAPVVLRPPVSVPASFAPDGSHIVFTQLEPKSSFDLWSAGFKMEAGVPALQAAKVLYAGPGIEGQPAVSPDGRWVAYGSSESGEWEVYVRPFQRAGSSVRVSTRGGRMPVWSRVAPEIIYLSNDQQLQIVRYRDAGETLVPGKAESWSMVRLANTGAIPNFDLAADGKRAIALMPSGNETGRPGQQLDVVLNAFAPE